MQRVFVQVTGFSDVERHALNTLFRLSEERAVGYALWTSDYGVPPDLALIDSDSHEALVEFESPSSAGLKKAWIGPGAPAQAWRQFDRPLQWPDVIAAMDQLFQPVPEVDLDFDLGGPDTLPPTETDPAQGAKRALIASAHAHERLYLRARLSLADLTQADEAANASDALELARRNRYEVALVDFSLPGVTGWDLLRQLRAAQPDMPHLIVTKDKVSAGDRVRGWREGTGTFLPKPLEPAKLKALLGRL